MTMNTKGTKFIQTDMMTFRNCFILCWAAEGVGFGEITFKKVKGSWQIDSELMSKDFVKAALAAWVDIVPIKDAE